MGAGVGWVRRWWERRKDERWRARQRARQRRDEALEARDRARERRDRLREEARREALAREDLLEYERSRWRREYGMEESPHGETEEEDRRGVRKEEGSHRLTGWESWILAEADRLRLDLARALASDELPRGSSRIVGEVSRALHDVALSVQRPTLRRRIIDGWTGARFEAALAALHRARKGLLWIQPTSAVLARVPDLRASMKARLPVTDPRLMSSRA
jgi:hypothetical protein